MANIIVADHHPITTSGLRNILDEEYEIVAVVNDAKDLNKTLEVKFPDLLILELELPNLKGLSTIKALRRDFPGIKILVYSMHAEEMYALSAIKAGAMGYIDKTADVKSVYFAIHQVKRGGIYLNEKLGKMLTTSESSNNIAYRYKKLSSRETEVLTMLSDGKRNKDIADHLKINEKTVSTYKTRLLKKLDVSSLADLIKQARILQMSDL
ncbi:MAG: response regulator transcription factor [Leeuwenhoekiella sp.]